jgi:amino acid adenylation domain-containing protein
MIVAIIAVLKTGAAYVPVDPSFPKERIDFILSDTNASLLLTQKHLLNQNDKLHGINTLTVDLEAELYTRFPIEPVPHNATADNLAYVIYTSGTTGKPKGVMIEHKSVVNLITSLTVDYEIQPNENFLLFSNYIFDASVEQMWLSIASNGTLHVADSKSILEPTQLEYLIDHHKIHHFNATPSYINSLDPAILHKCRRLIFGGEMLKKETLTKYKHDRNTVINAYGPTECTITSLISINSHYLNNKRINNTNIYVLDEAQNPVPIGVVGELHISGLGVARGYLNQPHLTNQQFIPNPFAPKQAENEHHAKLYKTGDLCRWRADGTIEYIGRNDQQIKIRGYRIELQEIESVINTIPNVKQSCVIKKTKHSNDETSVKLIAYYVPKLNQIVDTDYVVAMLKTSLPEFMMPDFVMEITTIPLTPTGKLDFSNLPEPQYRKTSEQPETTDEAKVCELWQKSLNIPSVGINDDFFKLGGNSLVAIQVSHQMSRLLQREIKVAAIFKHKSIRSIIKNTNIQNEAPKSIWKF